MHRVALRHQLGRLMLIEGILRIEHEHGLLWQTAQRELGKKDQIDVLFCRLLDERRHFRLVFRLVASQVHCNACNHCHSYPSPFEWLFQKLSVLNFYVPNITLLMRRCKYRI